jgi:hypothetical protein
MIDPLGYKSLQSAQAFLSDAPAPRETKLKSPYGIDLFTPSEARADEAPQTYRKISGLKSDEGAQIQAYGIPGHRPGEAAQEKKPDLSPFSKLACAGLAALSLFGGLIAAHPAMAAPTTGAPSSQTKVIPKTVDTGKTQPSAKDAATQKTQQGTKDAATQKTQQGTEVAATRKTQQVNVNPTYAEIEKKLEAAADKYGVPRDVMKAVAWQESFWEQFDSKGNPTVQNNRGRGGKILSRDWGIMQINDHYHPTAFPEAKTDIDANIDYSARLLRDLRKESKSWNGAVIRYNGNRVYLTHVQRHMKKKPWEAAKALQAKQMAEKAAEEQSVEQPKAVAIETPTPPAKAR